MAAKKDNVMKILGILSDFLKPLLPIANAHMVHFITNDYWNSLLPPGIQQDLLALSEEQLVKLPEDFLCYGQDNASHFGVNLRRFMGELHHHNRLFLDVVDDLQDVWQQLQIESLQSNVQFRQFMKVKKTYEVGVLSDVICSLANHSQSKIVIDLGCGKGALGSVVSLNQGLLVWGIDAVGYNAHSEAQRLSLFEKTYLAEAKKASDLYTEKKTLNFHRSVSFVTGDVDLIKLKETSGLNIADSEFVNLGLTGLHTCGDLASTSLKLFVQSVHMKFICNVGCCYHLLNEIYEAENENHQRSLDHRGFPLSEVLLKRKYSLGRNARMMSAQPLERYAAEKKLQPEVLFHRALLQVVLVDKLKLSGSAAREYRVGKLRRPVPSFVDYAEWALKKLNLNIEVSAEELKAYENRLHHQKRLMDSFFQFRLLIAPLVESLILLDRLAYLLEQETVSAAFLVRLFSPVTSPRCYGLIAMKRNS